jgi:hypothetical protein
MLRTTIMAVMALFVTGCAGKHVTFFHPGTVPDAPREVRIFLDARGDLYPRTGVLETYILPDAAQGSLFEAARGADPALCANAADGSEMAELCAVVKTDCAGPSTPACFERWESVQAQLWQRRGAAIATRFSSDGGAATLGVLIHGFNNWYRESQTNYATSEKQMIRFAEPGQRLYFIEVYWDGCRGNDAGIGCWGKAQSSGPLAGFALRQMFNAVEEAWSSGTAKPHWRVLTHSSGAFVAGAIFGDPTAALPQLQKPVSNRWYERFAQYRRSADGPYRVPMLSNVKLAMLAPATPSITFGGAQSGGGVLARGLAILTVVQPDDSALNKKGLGCQRVGVSCLGARQEQFCNLRQAIATNDLGITVSGYDFRRARDMGK